MNHTLNIPTAHRYDRIAIFFHWSLAVLVPCLIGLGWYMLSIEEQPDSAWYFALHVSLGLTAAALMALRISWGSEHRPPPLPAAMAIWQATAARLSHLLMYVLLVLMPITGYLGASFSGEAVAYFGAPLPAWAGKNDALKELLFGAHSIIAWVLVSVICIHVLGALKHVFVDKDTLLRRMWFR